MKEKRFLRMPASNSGKRHPFKASQETKTRTVSEILAHKVEEVNFLKFTKSRLLQAMARNPGITWDCLMLFQIVTTLFSFSNGIKKSSQTKGIEKEGPILGLRLSMHSR